MDRDCVLALDNLAPVRKVFLTRRLTSLGPVPMAAVCRALAAAVDCPSR